MYTSLLREDVMFTYSIENIKYHQKVTSLSKGKECLVKIAFVFSEASLKYVQLIIINY